MNRTELVTMFKAFEAAWFTRETPREREWDHAYVVIDDAADVLLGKKEECNVLTMLVGNGRYNSFIPTFGETDTRAGTWITAGNGKTAIFKGSMSGAIKLVAEGIPCLENQLKPQIKSILNPSDELLANSHTSTVRYLKHILTPAGMKLRALKPGVMIMLKAWPDVRLKILSSKVSEEDSTCFLMHIAFPNGMNMPLCIDTKLEGVVLGNSISLDAIIVVDDPSVEDRHWCDQHKVTL